MSSASVPGTLTALQKRRSSIKAGNDPTDLRRRRADTTISLRKQKKEQGLAKRRNTASSASASASSVSGGESAAPSSSAAPGAKPRTPSAEDVPELTQALSKADPSARVEAARGLRKVLSLESDPPVTEVIQAGAMPLLVNCLGAVSNTDLQVGSARWYRYCRLHSWRDQPHRAPRFFW